ncbi:NCS2 family permease (plasmid) [Borrelia sp. A-FGy1]|uniref:NCS2 family permease n=1 Tax=Borrelia sp. A-FGy1 TaxID=2608247 RepID=UPI0015F749D0|nr:NCS2 family permease [Borrelia sp. A-FGy1]QMU99626.1 NCS2 family permease [Borrelia sp. A-FGy1]
MKETLLFQFKNNTINYKQEIYAGITTFLSMAYIIAVNPAILSNTGMPSGALVTATCFISAFSTILMGVYANTPLALSCGMGLNAFFAFSIVIGMNIPWQVALSAVFIEGILFIILSLTKIKESIINSIPMNLKYATSVGIGLFIAFIGFVNSGIIIKNEVTLIGLGQFNNIKVYITFIGLFSIIFLAHYKIRGSILYSIIITTAIAWSYALFYEERAKAEGIYLPDGVLRYESITPIFNKLDFSYITKDKIWSFVFIVLILLFNDLFDTVGTIIGVAKEGNMLDDKGTIHNAGKILLVDAISTTAGALLGVSTVTTYIESSTGIAEGGKTGFTSIVTGILFLISIFFAPLFVAVPSSATAPTLIYVGFLMFKGIKNIDLTNTTETIPSFLTLILIPLSYSIGSGLSIGIVSYVIIKIIYDLIIGEVPKISPLIIILAFIFIIKLIFYH